MTTSQAQQAATLSRRIALGEELALEEAFVAEVDDRIAERFARGDHAGAFRLRREKASAEAHVLHLRAEIGGLS